MSCRDGSDLFPSADAACDGKTVLGVAGHIWTAAPAGMASRQLYRCSISGERYTSADPSCEGHTVDRPLGYVLTAVPATSPSFP